MMRADGFEVDRLNALTDDFGGPYDLVFADAVFLHFDRAQLRTVLEKAHKAAGLIAFTTRAGDGAEWTHRFLDLPRHVTLWQEQPLRALVAETGWTVEHFRTNSATTSDWHHVLGPANVRLHSVVTQLMCGPVWRLAHFEPWLAN